MYSNVGLLFQKKQPTTHLIVRTASSLESNTNEPNADTMVDIKSMKTLPIPSVEAAFLRNTQATHAMSNSVAYQTNFHRVVAADNRESSGLVDDVDLIVILSSGINNNVISDDAELETAQAVHQVTQAVNAVCTIAQFAFVSLF